MLHLIRKSSFRCPRNHHRAARRRRLVEHLERRNLLAVVWDGGGNDSQWNNPLNWDSDTLPGVADEVVIDVAGSQETIEISSPVSIRSLVSQENLNISGGVLSVSDNSSIVGDLTMALGTTIQAIGSGASLSATGAAAIDGASLRAIGGASITITGAQQYLVNVSDGAATISADGAGSSVSLPAVTQMTGFGRNGQIDINALSGGVVDLPSLTEIASGTVIVRAADAGSEVRLPSLMNWTDTNRNRESYVQLNAGGDVQLSSLQSLTSVGTRVYDGETLELPALTQLAGSGRLFFQHIADGAGSVLSFPALTDATGGDLPVGRMEFLAQAGGEVSLPALTSINGGAVRATVSGVGSHFSAPELLTWNDSNQYVDSILRLNSGGNISLPKLESVESVGFQVYDGETLQLPALNTIAGTGRDYFAHVAEGVGSVLSLPSLTTASGGFLPVGRMEFLAQAGGEVSLPALTSINGGAVRATVSGVGSHFSAPELLTWSDSNQYVDSILRLNSGGNISLPKLESVESVGFQVYDGETLQLPALSTIAGTGRDYFAHVAEGVGSVLSLPALTTASGGFLPVGRMEMHANSGGAISLPSLTSIVGGATQISVTGSGSQFSAPGLTDWTDDSYYEQSFIRLYAGGSVDLNNLQSMTAAGVQVYDGQVLSMPALTSMQGASRDLFAHIADGAGSELSFPALTTATGSFDPLGALQVVASNGGTVQLPLLTEITGGATVLAGRDTGSLVNAPELLTWIDDSSSTDSWIEARDGGDVTLPKLVSGQAFAVNASGGSVVTLPSLQTITGASNNFYRFFIDGAGSEVNLPALTALEASFNPSGRLDVAITDGGKLRADQLESITSGSTRITVAGLNSGIEFPALQTFAHTSFLESFVIVEQGVVQLGTGVVDISGVRLTPKNGGTIQGGTFQLDAQTRLTGDGIVQADIVNAGLLAPGDGGFGTLSVQGDYQQTATGIYQLEIDETQNDLLQVTGQASLCGTINIIQLATVAPAIGDQAEIMTYGSVVGDFVNFQGHLLGTGQELSTVVEPNQMFLKAVESIPPEIVTLQANPQDVTQGDLLDLQADGVSDSNGVVAGVEFFWDSDQDGNFDICHDTLLGAATTGGSWSVDVDTSVLAVGTYRVFAVAIDDDGLRSNVVSQTFNVLEPPVNTAPDAVDDLIETTEDTPILINVLSNDVDAEDNLQTDSVSVTLAPSNGTVVVNIDGTILYTPAADFEGSDQFRYEVSDSFGLSDGAMVTVTVTPVADAVDDTATTLEDTPVEITVLANDTFADPNAAVVAVSLPSHGSATISPDGRIAYTPAAGYFGSDTLSYTVSAGGTTEVASVTIIIEEVDIAEPPVFVSVTVPSTAVAGQSISFQAETQQVSDSITWNVYNADNILLASGSGTSLEFQPQEIGDHTVEVTATNEDGSVSQTLGLEVQAIGVVDQDLYVAGTDENDFIRVYRRHNGDIVVFNWQHRLGRFSGVSGEIIVHAFAGDDAVYVSNQVTNDAQIFGGVGRDWLVGGSGTDRIDGGEGQDWIDGRRGDDVLLGAEDADVIYGGKGDDWIDGGAGDDWLFGEQGNDILIGGDGDDVLFGGRGRDLLQGMEGNDVLLGGAGHDELDGGPGFDIVLQGGNWWC